MSKLPKLPKSKLRPPPGFKKAKVEDFQADMQRLGEDIAEEFKERVIGNIESNRFGYLLASETIERKGSDIPLIDSGELIAAIYRDETTVSVEDTPRSDTQCTNLELAIIQEYGTKDLHVPARPVWRETFREFKRMARKDVISFLETTKFKKSRK